MTESNHSQGHLTGCIPVLLTPFNEDRSIDFDALERLVEHAVNNQVEALWVLGTGGEDMALSLDKRWSIASYLSENFATRIKLLVGCGFDALEDTLNLAERINDLNVHAVHYMPYQSLMGLDAIEQNYRSLADITRHPVWLYTSDNWGRTLPPAFLDRFTDDGRFAGCKFSTANIVKFENAFRRNREGFQVIPAVIKQLLPALAIGAKAFTSVEASLFLKRIRQIETAFASGDLTMARQAQSGLNRIIEASVTESAKQNFLRNAEIKAVLERKGVCGRWMAKGFVDIDKNDIDPLVNLYDNDSDNPV